MQGMMLSRLFGSDTKLKDIASDLYGVIVARARTPVLYLDLGVPDTTAGRFEMVVLHLIVVTDRLDRGSERERNIGQRLFEVFCTDMDETLREFGVSDVAMGKRMKGMTLGFYGRKDAYLGALALDDRDEMARALGRNIQPDQDRAAEPALSVYVFEFASQVAEVGEGKFETGQSGLADTGTGVAR
ncbi:MAG: ubiquinol-cytochrome C chaperone [Boseongicola sp.]